MGNRGFIAALLAGRAQVVELLAAAVALGFGVNLLAGYVASQLSANAQLWLGLLAAVGAFAFLAGRLLWPRSREEQLHGFFLCEARTNRPLRHPYQYRFASRIERYLSSAFAENPALRAIWDKSPIGAAFSDPDAPSPKDTSESRELVRQAAEYFVLDHLSSHLEGYFARAEVGDEALSVLRRTDIPDILLQNRFMRLFTEPMEERAAFLRDRDRSGVRVSIRRYSGPGRWETFSEELPGVALYERFELALPKGSSVGRRSPDTIEISTKRFNVIITTMCDGMSVVLPRDYDRYLGLRDGVRRSAFAVDMEVRIEPRRVQLLTRRGWVAYRWIDRWLEVLANDVSKDRFLERIGYESAHTTYALLRGHQFEGTRGSRFASARASVEAARER